MKNLKEEIVNNDEIINIVNEIKILIKEDRYTNHSIKEFKKRLSRKIMILEETLIIYQGAIDVKILKTDFSDKKWKHLTKKISKFL